VGQETHDTLRRLQDLLRREVPDGDAAVIVARALKLLLETTEKAKFAQTPRPSRRPARPIRPGADDEIRTPPPPSSYVPAAVQREVWTRDGGQCAFVSPRTGRRCTERSFLEFHHLRPRSWRGEATASNLSLRCRRHHDYETALVFGTREWHGRPRSRSRDVDDLTAT
jgi:5-methylcytosine-specific restriction endonuclease McrA